MRLDDPAMIVLGPGPSTAAAGVPVVVAPLLTITDPDDTVFLEAWVRIEGMHNATDALSITLAHGITGAYDPLTGVLALAGEATIAEYVEVFRTVTYESSASDGTAFERLIHFDITDEPEVIPLGYRELVVSACAGDCGTENDGGIDGGPHTRGGSRGCSLTPAGSATGVEGIATLLVAALVAVRRRRHRGRG